MEKSDYIFAEMSEIHRRADSVQDNAIKTALEGFGQQVTIGVAHRYFDGTQDLSSILRRRLTGMVQGGRAYQIRPGSNPRPRPASYLRAGPVLKLRSG